MSCNICKKNTDDGLAFHRQCWRQWQARERRRDDEIMREAWAAIERGSADGCSALCRERYREQLDSLGKGKRGKGRGKVDL
jgi:hypothetical protein